MSLSVSSLSLRKYEPPHLLSRPITEFFNGAAGPQLKEVEAALPKDWRVYVVGGLLRDLLVEKLHKIPMAVADVDLVVDGAKSADEVHMALSKFHTRRNDFGGVKCQVWNSGILFDIWRIADHVNMARLPPPQTIEQLLRHFLLDVDALLWDVCSNALYEYGAIKAIERRRIDLIGTDGISEGLMLVQAVHVVSVAVKTGFEVSEKARIFIQRACKAGTSGELKRLLDRKFPAANEATKATIYALLYRADSKEQHGGQLP